MATIWWWREPPGGVFHASQLARHQYEFLNASLPPGGLQPWLARHLDWFESGRDAGGVWFQRRRGCSRADPAAAAAPAAAATAAPAAAAAPTAAAADATWTWWDGRWWWWDAENDDWVRS